MKKTISILSVLVVTVLAGCQLVPANRIEIKGPTGSYMIKTPKNVAIEDFKANIQTNGAIDITFARWSSTNDAQVIDKAYLGQAAVVSAWAGMVTNVAASAAEGAAKGLAK